MTQTTTGVAASTDTHCPYCALQCAMTLTRADGAAEGAAPVVVSGRDFPTNRGGLCKKGWTSAELLRSPDRLTAPLVRGADGELHETEWDAVLDLVADRLRSIRTEHGADAVAVFGGGGLTNEKAYQLGKFARLALGTSRIDYNGRFCMSSAAAAGNRAFGIDRGLPFPLSDLDAASTVLLLGTNVAATMPPFVGHLAGAQEAGGLIVVDPRRTATARLTDEGRGIHLQPTPGTDLALLLGPDARRHRRGTDGCRVPRRTHGRLRRPAAQRCGVVAGASPVRHRGARGDDPDGRATARGRRRRVHPHRPRSRAAHRRHRHGDGSDQPRSRAGPSRAGRLRVRHPHRTGQRAGRSGARPEVRPAARLPQDHRPRRPRARRGRMGRRTLASSPVPASPRSSSCRRWAPPVARARCSSTDRTSSCRHRTRRSCGPDWNGWTFSSSRTSSSPRRQPSQMSSCPFRSGPRRTGR